MAGAVARLIFGKSMQQQMVRPKLHLTEHSALAKKFQSDDDGKSEAKYLSKALEDAQRGDYSTLRQLSKQLGSSRLKEVLEKFGVKDDILKNIGEEGKGSFNVLRKTYENSNKQESQRETFSDANDNESHRSFVASNGTVDVHKLTFYSSRPEINSVSEMPSEGETRLPDGAIGKNTDRLSEGEQRYNKNDILDNDGIDGNYKNNKLHLRYHKKEINGLKKDNEEKAEADTYKSSPNSSNNEVSTPKISGRYGNSYGFKLRNFKSILRSSQVSSYSTLKTRNSLKQAGQANSYATSSIGPSDRVRDVLAEKTRYKSIEPKPLDGIRSYVKNKEELEKGAKLLGAGEEIGGMAETGEAGEVEGTREAKLRKVNTAESKDATAHVLRDKKVIEYIEGKEDISPMGVMEDVEAVGMKGSIFVDTLRGWKTMEDTSTVKDTKSMESENNQKFDGKEKLSDKTERTENVVYQEKELQYKSEDADRNKVSINGDENKDNSQKEDSANDIQAKRDKLAENMKDRIDTGENNIHELSKVERITKVGKEIELVGEVEEVGGMLESGETGEVEGMKEAKVRKVNSDESKDATGHVLREEKVIEYIEGKEDISPTGVMEDVEAVGMKGSIFVDTLRGWETMEDTSTVKDTESMESENNQKFNEKEEVSDKTEKVENVLYKEELEYKSEDVDSNKDSVNDNEDKDNSQKGENINDMQARGDKLVEKISDRIKTVENDMRKLEENEDKENFKKDADRCLRKEHEKLREDLKEIDKLEKDGYEMDKSKKGFMHKVEKIYDFLNNYVDPENQQFKQLHNNMEDAMSQLLEKASEVEVPMAEDNAKNNNQQTGYPSSDDLKQISNTLKRVTGQKRKRTSRNVAGHEAGSKKVGGGKRSRAAKASPSAEAGVSTQTHHASAKSNTPVASKGHKHGEGLEHLEHDNDVSSKKPGMEKTDSKGQKDIDKKLGHILKNDKAEWEDAKSSVDEFLREKTNNKSYEDQKTMIRTWTDEISTYLSENKELMKDSVCKGLYDHLDDICKYEYTQFDEINYEGHLKLNKKDLLMDSDDEEESGTIRGRRRKGNIDDIRREGDKLVENINDRIYTMENVIHELAKNKDNFEKNTYSHLRKEHENLGENLEKLDKLQKKGYQMDDKKNGLMHKAKEIYDVLNNYVDPVNQQFKQFHNNMEGAMAQLLEKYSSEVSVPVAENNAMNNNQPNGNPSGDTLEKAGKKIGEVLGGKKRGNEMEKEVFVNKFEKLAIVGRRSSLPKETLPLRQEIAREKGEEMYEVAKRHGENLEEILTRIRNPKNDYRDKIDNSVRYKAEFVGSVKDMAKNEEEELIYKEAGKHMYDTLLDKVRSYERIDEIRSMMEKDKENISAWIDQNRDTINRETVKKAVNEWFTEQSRERDLKFGNVPEPYSEGVSQLQHETPKGTAIEGR